MAYYSSWAPEYRIYEPLVRLIVLISTSNLCYDGLNSDV